MTAAADRATLDRIREKGFAVVPGVLDRDTVGTMKQELQRAIDDDLAAWAGRDYPDAWMVHNLMVRHPVFARFLENPVLHAYLTPLLDDTCIVYAYTSSSMPPSGARSKPRHQASRRSTYDNATAGLAASAIQS